MPSFGTDIFERGQELKLAQEKMDGALYPNLSVLSSFRSRLEAWFPLSTRISYLYNAFVMARHALGIFSDLMRKPTSEKLLTLMLESACSESSEGGVNFDFPLVLREIREEGFWDYAPPESIQLCEYFAEYCAYVLIAWEGWYGLEAEFCARPPLSRGNSQKQRE